MIAPVETAWMRLLAEEAENLSTIAKAGRVLCANRPPLPYYSSLPSSSAEPCLAPDLEELLLNEWKAESDFNHPSWNKVRINSFQMLEFVRNCYRHIRMIGKKEG